MDSDARVPSVREEFCEWRASDLQGAENFLVRLSPSEEREIGAALLHIQRRDLASTRLRRADVPLNGLCSRLASLRDDVVFGRGFGLVRRLPVERLTDEETDTLFAGLSAHIGRLRPLFGAEAAVADWEGVLAPGADLVGLLCQRGAPFGTSVTLTNAVAVHNTLARSNADLLPALYQPLASGPAVFSAAGRFLSVRLGSGSFASLGADAADSRQREACEVANDIARRCSVELELEPGDLLLVNRHHVGFTLTEHGMDRFGLGAFMAARAFSAPRGRVRQVAMSSPHLVTRESIPLAPVPWAIGANDGAVAAA